MPDARTLRKNAGSPTFVCCTDGARLSDCFRDLATISALEPVSGVQHRLVKLVVHVQPLTSCCYKWARGKHSFGVSIWDQSSMAHFREVMENDIGAAWKLWHLLAGSSAFPSRILRQCPWSSGWRSGSEGEFVARLWRRHRQASERSKVWMNVEVMRYWKRFLAPCLKTPSCSMGQEPIHCWCRPATSCELGR